MTTLSHHPCHDLLVCKTTCHKKCMHKIQACSIVCGKKVSLLRPGTFQNIRGRLS